MPKNQNINKRSNFVTNSIKTFKMVHIKKKNLKNNTVLKTEHLTISSKVGRVILKPRKVGRTAFCPADTSFSVAAFLQLS